MWSKTPILADETIILFTFFGISARITSSSFSISLKINITGISLGISEVLIQTFPFTSPFEIACSKGSRLYFYLLLSQFILKQVLSQCFPDCLLKLQQDKNIYLFFEQ